MTGEGQITIEEKNLLKLLDSPQVVFDDLRHIVLAGVDVVAEPGEEGPRLQLSLPAALGQRGPLLRLRSQVVTLEEAVRL